MNSKAELHAFLRRNPFPHPLTEGFFYREKMRAIHRVAPERSFARILEIGGGRSGLTKLLYPSAHVTNADVDADHASAPPNQAADVEFVHADATRLPFADGFFECVTMFDVLEHIEDDAIAVREALRVLSSGGVLLITSPSENWRFPRYRLLEPICPTDVDMMATWGHVRRGYSARDLEALTGMPTEAAATFISPLTSFCHDVSFSKLPSRIRRLLCVCLSPLTWTGYWLERNGDRGTEIAARFTMPE
jgi:ubiquinone/menaquinone biosynthesis C-methylase UbiE